MLSGVLVDLVNRQAAFDPALDRAVLVMGKIVTGGASNEGENFAELMLAAGFRKCDLAWRRDDWMLDIAHRLLGHLFHRQNVIHQTGFNRHHQMKGGIENRHILIRRVEVNTFGFYRSCVLDLADSHPRVFGQQGRHDAFVLGAQVLDNHKGETTFRRHDAEKASRVSRLPADAATPTITRSLFPGAVFRTAFRGGDF
jgi:hypothetical protein